MRATILLLAGVQLFLGTIESDLNRICGTTNDTLIPHMTKCSLYYNCSAPARSTHWEKNLQECDHPQVYNPDTRRCEHYTMVDCGAREMPLGPCDYKYTQCVRLTCRPCSVDFPSCRGSPDGLNSYPNRPGSAQFIVCSKQRVVYSGTCAVTPEGVTQIYDPARRTCVEVTSG